MEVFSIGIGPVRNRWPEVHAYVAANGLYTTVEQISVLTGQIWTVGVYTKLRVRAEGSKGQSDRRCMAIVSQFNRSVHHTGNILQFDWQITVIRWGIVRLSHWCSRIKGAFCAHVY